MSAASAPPPLPGERPARKKRRWIWIIPGIIVIGILGIVAIGLFFEMTATDLDVTDADRAAVLDIGELRDWIEDFTPEMTQEVWSKKRYIDGSIELDYEYDEPDNENAPYLSCTVNFDRKPSEAKITYLASWNSMKIGLGLNDARVDERNDLFSFGDPSMFGLLMSGDEPFGNALAARIGSKSVLIVFSGVYFDDSEALAELLEPTLKSLEAYDPEE